MKRYKELKFGDKTYTETYKINEILAKNGFEWFLDCEVENVRLEITKNTLVFNSGVFFNGNWEYGVFRDGQWKYGTWEGGVWYNGTWYNGIYKNGLIFNGRFLNGKIEGGEIRGGDFFDIEISRNVITNIEQPSKHSPKPQQGTPINRGEIQKIQSTQVQQPMQSQDLVENKMTVKFEKFLNEGVWDKFKSKIGLKGDDDEIGKKLLKYLNSKEVDVRYIKNYKGFELFFSINSDKINDIDPYNEDNLGDVLNISIKYNKSFDVYRGPYIFINDDKLDLNVSLREKISLKVHKIYENNINRIKSEEKRAKQQRLNNISKKIDI